MKKFLIGAVLSVAAVFASAQTIDTSRLTKEQVAQLQAQAAEMQSNPGQTAVIVRQEAEAWADLGGKVGMAMVSAAKEVGMAANEFASTELGTVVTAIVVYKIIGTEIMSLFGGFVILLVGVPVSLWVLMKKSTWAYEIDYEYQKYLGGFWNRRVIKHMSMSDEGSAFRWIIGVGGLVITLATGIATAIP